MNLENDPLESRLDALGRAMALQSAAPPPAGYLAAVQRQRQVIVINRIGLVAAAGAALTLLILLANYRHHLPREQAPQRPAAAVGQDDGAEK